MRRRINRLIADVMRSPFEGIGQPEALKVRIRAIAKPLSSEYAP